MQSLSKSIRWGFLTAMFLVVSVVPVLAQEAEADAAVTGVDLLLLLLGVAGVGVVGAVVFGRDRLRNGESE